MNRMVMGFIRVLFRLLGWGFYSGLFQDMLWFHSRDEWCQVIILFAWYG